MCDHLAVVVVVLCILVLLDYNPGNTALFPYCSSSSMKDEVVKTLKTAIQTGVMPHLLFYGPPGTGKTSTILAVARTLFGPVRLN